MARPLRVHFPGAIYHVTGRMLGSWKEEKNLLFRDDRDRKRFLDRLELGVEDFEVRIFLFCLMSNHFHLLVETPRGNLSQFMQSLNTAYTVYFNRRHQRHGHLLDGRFKAQLVAKDEYLLKLSRYIHLNPVATAKWKSRSIEERLRRLRAYRWSSFPGYCGASKPYPFVVEGPIMALTGLYGRPGHKGYQNYIEAGMADSDWELEEVMRHARLGIGDEDFRTEVQRELFKARSAIGREEDVSFRRMSRTLDVEKVLKAVIEIFGIPEEKLRMSQRGVCYRPAAARCLIRYAGCSQREAAVYLGVKTGAAISAQIKLLATKEKTDRKLRKQLKQLETRLKQESDDLNGRKHEDRKFVF